MTNLYRYAELNPEALAGRLNQRPIAVVPWGALEWHGPHLPFGLDGLVAEAFAERLAARLEAVLLPSTYLPITALPHPQSISIHTDHVRGVWRDLLRGLGKAGFRLICLISGHYAQGHEIELAEAAAAATDEGAATILAATPLGLLERPALLDHAGRWETAQLLALRPDLARLDRLGDGPLPGPHDVAVLGEDPRRATAEEGEAILAEALDAWATWADRLLAGEALDELRALYARRRASYEDYVRRFHRSSWEQAILDWWAEAG